MPRLEDFREMIDSCSDEKVLESGQQLLREMIEIRNLQMKLDELNSGLTNGGKAIFYFFAEELNEDEVVFAAERISGRIKRLERKKSEEMSKNKKDGNIEEKDEHEEGSSI